MQKFTAKRIAESNARYLVDDLGLSEQDLLRAVLALITFAEEDTTLSQHRAQVAIKTAICELDAEDSAKR